MAPAGLTTPAARCNLDNAAADFALGSVVNTMVTESQGGEVTLAAPLRTEFDTPPPTSQFQAFAWTGGGGAPATVSGGKLLVDGQRVDSEPLSGFNPGC